MRAVIEYPYRQRGSTKHWDRGQGKFRNAAPVEHSASLGACLAEHNHKTVWIEVHVEIEPGTELDEASDDYEREADAAFLTLHPGHIILP